MVVGKDSGTVEKSKNKAKKLARKREEEQAKAKEDAAVEIAMDSVLKPGGRGELTNKRAGLQQKVAKQTPPAKVVSALDEEESDANSEVEEQEKILDRKGKNPVNGLKAFEQRDLVALAFAGDNVVQVSHPQLESSSDIKLIYLCGCPYLLIKIGF